MAGYYRNFGRSCFQRGLYSAYSGVTGVTGVTTAGPIAKGGGPAPLYVRPNISLDKNVVNPKDPLTVTLSFVAEKDIALDETTLAFYPHGKQEPAWSVLMSEWSHVNLKKGEERRQNVTLVPYEKGLDAGYYQAALEFQTGGTRISAPVDLQISYAPGTIRSGRLDVRQYVTKEGYTLTVNTLTMSDDKVTVDVQFAPQVLEFFTNIRLEDGRQLRQFGRDGARTPQPEHQQFTFSPIPKSANQITFEIESVNIQKPDGIYGVPGHWAVTISLPPEPKPGERPENGSGQAAVAIKQESAPDKTASTAPSPTTAPSTAPVSAPPKMAEQNDRIEKIIHYDNGETFWALGHGALLRSEDNGRHWSDISPKGVRIDAAGDGFDLFAFRRGQSQIDVYQNTFDTEQGWKHSVLPTADEWELSGNFFFSKHFVGDEDRLLITSDGKQGETKAALYLISRNEPTWVRVGELSEQLAGKPTGIAFRSAKEGWITCSQGVNDIVVYRTKDGGKSWNKEKMAVPREAADGSFTGNAFPPVFDEESDNHWALPVEIVRGKEHFMVYYETRNGGDSWSIPSTVYPNVKRPGAYQLDPTYGKGFALSDDGDKLYGFTLDSYPQIFSGPVPAPYEMNVSPNLKNATEMYLRIEKGDTVRTKGWALLNGNFYIPQDEGRAWVRPITR